VLYTVRGGTAVLYTVRGEVHLVVYPEVRRDGSAAHGG